MTKQQFANFLRGFIVICALIGLSFLLPNDLYKLTYYTNISNIIVVMFYGYLLFTKKTVNDNPLLLRFKACVTICIALTFLVYAILLAPIAEPQDFYHIKNYTLHYIVPILTLIDWFFLDRKGAYKVIDPLWWTFIPLIYCLFSIIKGYVFRVPIPNEPNSPYPYFFINVDKYGWSGFFGYVIAILFCYILLGYTMYAIKRKK